MIWLMSPVFLRRALVPFFAVLLVGCQSLSSSEKAEGAKSAADLQFSADSMLRVADNLVKARDYTSALRFYQDVLERDPKNIQALLGQGEIFLILDAPGEAAERFQAVTTLEPKEGRGDAGLARALTQLNEPERALPYFAAAVEKGAVSAKFYNHYGIAYDLMGKHQDAQVQYGRGLDLMPGDVSLLNNLGLSLALAEDYLAAVRLLSDVVSATPDMMQARQNLALAYAFSGDMTTALRLATFPENAAATEQAQTYLRNITALPKDMRGKAIFSGLSAVADALPKTNLPQVVSEPLPPPSSTSPAIVDVNTAPAKTQALTAAPAAAPSPPAKAVTATPSTAAAPPPDGGYMVQLSAYQDQALARAGWDKFKALAPDLLGARQSIITEAGAMTRLGAVAADKKDAAALCDALKKVGVDCIVRQLSGNPNE